MTDGCFHVWATSRGSHKIQADQTAFLSILVLTDKAPPTDVYSPAKAIKDGGVNFKCKSIVPNAIKGFSGTTSTVNMFPTSANILHIKLKTAI
jgi:hypothetical protein